MTTIDQRVVQMKFDNQQFEHGIKTTLGSLESLNKGLKLEGATKGLTDVSAAAKNFSLAHIASGVDAIASKFQALSIIGITALTNIANKAVTAGLQLTKSLTISPVTSGLHEYETNLNAIQTILANTGLEGQTGLNKVNAALQILNDYSDKTIYNFSEMARNIGTFTAAGVKLDVATSAIKGIANLAAVSGSNAEQASTAMYQLSQALAAGKVSLMDWNSVVNAGMGGKVFQDALMETARVHHVSIDKMVKDAGSFRLSLEKGWLTSGILTETLSKFTGDLSAQQLKSMGYNQKQIAGILKMGQTAQDAATKVKTFSQLINTLQEAAGSGWAKTWQLVFGDFDQAKVLFTNVNNVLGGFIGASSDARNKVLGDWNALGGRTVIIEAISNAFHALISVVTPIKDAFREIFPAATGKQLFDLSVKIRDFTAKLKIGDETAAKIKRTFAGVFAVFGLGIDVIKGVAKVLGGLLYLVTKNSGGFLNFTARVGDWLVNLRKSIKDGASLNEFFDKLSKNLQHPKEILKAISTYIKNLFDGFNPSAGDKFVSIFDKIGQAVRDAWKAIQPFIHNVGTFLAGLGKSIVQAISGLSLNDILGIVATGSVAGIALAIGTLVKKITGLFNNKDKGLFGTIKESFDKLTDTLKTMQNSLRAATLIEIAIALGLLTISVIALSKIDAEALNKALIAMTIMFAQLGGALYIFEQHLGVKDTAKMIGLAVAMTVLGVAIKILASAVKDLADLDWPGLTKGLIGVTVLLAGLTVSVKFMPDDKKLISTGIALVILAAAIKILVSSVKDLSDLSWEQLTKGLTGVAVLLAALTLFSKFSEADKAGILSGAGILLLAVGINILADAMVKIANLSWEQIGKGLAGIAAGLALVIGSIMLVPPIGFISGAGFLIISLGLAAMADSLQKLGKMSWLEIAKGLVALLGVMTILTAALYVIPPTAPIAAAGVLIMAKSLLEIGNFLQKMSDLSWEQIGKAMTVLFGSLTIISAAMILMTGAIPGAIALVIVSGALTILSAVLVTLGNMSWEAIVKGLGTLAGVFLLLGVAGLVLTPVIPTLLGLGIAITLLGVGMLAAGVGVLAFGAGLTALSLLGVVATQNIVNIVQSLMGLIPQVMGQIAQGILAFAQVIATGGPAITMAMTTVLLSLITAIDTVSPKIIETLFKLLWLFYETLLKYVPKLVDAGLKILTGFLQGIANNLGSVITAATNVIVAFINGIANNLHKIIQAGFNLVISFIEGLAKAIRENSDRMGKAGGDLATAIIEGMVKGLSSGAGRIATAAGNAARSALSAAMHVLDAHSPSREFFKLGVYSVDGFVNALDENTGRVEKSGRGIGNAALDTVRKSLSSLSDLMSGDIDMTPVITPVLDLTDIKKTAGEIGSLLSTKPISVAATYSSAKGVSNSYQSNSNVDPANTDSTSKGNSLTFYQYNNSPRPLSAVEIYRQTKNQLSVAKGALTT